MLMTAHSSARQGSTDRDSSFPERFFDPVKKHVNQSYLPGKVNALAGETAPIPGPSFPPRQEEKIVTTI